MRGHELCAPRGDLAIFYRYLVFWLCGVLGHLALVHRCVRLVRCVCPVLCHLALVPWCAREVWSVCLVPRLLALDQRCPRQVSGVRCPWSLGACSPVCAPDMLCWR